MAARRREAGHLGQISRCRSSNRQSGFRSSLKCYPLARFPGSLICRQIYLFLLSFLPCQFTRTNSFGRNRGRWNKGEAAPPPHVLGGAGVGQRPALPPVCSPKTLILSEYCPFYDEICLPFSLISAPSLLATFWRPWPGVAKVKENSHC